jgi:hypothetical protein
VRVVVVDRVLETDLRDPEKKRPAQSQHVADQTIFPWKKVMSQNLFYLEWKWTSIASSSEYIFSRASKCWLKNCKNLRTKQNKFQTI